MHPIKLLRPARLALLVFLALPVAPGFAEDKPAPGTAQPVPHNPRLISLDFPGGPLSKLVAMLARKDGATLSVIQSAGLDPALPAFSVRDVQVDAVISALGRLLEPQGYALAPVGSNLAVLQEAHWTKPPQAFASLQIETKLGGQSIEEFIAVIQAACEFANSSQKPSTLRFKYHPGTKLLFVAGAPLEIEVTHQVFGNLPDKPVKFTPPSSEKK